MFFNNIKLIPWRVKLKTDCSKTPIADKLLKLRESTNYSFHSLPIFQEQSLLSSKLLLDKYRSIFGDELFGCELTTTGQFFDNFFFPSGVILESEEATSKLFGADGTLYVTTGTTTSNQIAASALYKNKGRVLIDKNCHQSIHFVFNAMGAQVDYIEKKYCCEKSERSAWDINDVLEKIKSSEALGVGYELIVLTAQSYEGLVYDIPGIINELIGSGVSTKKFLIDEAWGAANYFNPVLKPLTAMRVEKLLSNHPNIEVVTTQSAHKSLSAMRQASMIHFRGGLSLQKKLRSARFQIHTTSPSYPILASLDLARAQMSLDGERLLSQSLDLTKMFKQRLKDEKNLSCYGLCDESSMKSFGRFVKSDPCKISINVEALCLSGNEVRDFLYKEHKIYVNRVTEKSILLNFHIGITMDAVNAILDGLVDLQKKQISKSVIKIKSDKFIVPYPPGVPIVVPGDEITTEVARKIGAIKNSGVTVVEI